MCELFPFFVAPPCNVPLPGEHTFGILLNDEVSRFRRVLGVDFLLRTGTLDFITNWLLIDQCLHSEECIVHCCIDRV